MNLKNLNQILFLVLFLISSTYAFSGTSSSYQTSTNIGSLGGSSNISSSIIIGSGYSDNYLIRLGGQDYNVSTLVLKPEINIISPINNSYSNISKRGINFNANFTKNIREVIYTNLDKKISLTNLINRSSGLNVIDTIIPINYGQNILQFTFIDIYGFSNNYELYVNTNLTLNGSVSDFDGDGINDSEDTVVGEIKNIYTNINNFTLEINNSKNLSKVFDREINVSFLRENKTLIKFKNNFATRDLDLTSLIVKDDKTENESKVLISGLDIGSDTKTIFIELFGDIIKYNSLCIKDAEIDDFEDISSDCTGADETYVGSIPVTIGSYVVSYTDVTNKTVQVEGLSHSGVSQTCTEGWSYGDWSSCSGGVQTRSATDSNSCGSINTRQAVSQSCTSSSGGGSSGGGSSGGSGGGTYVILNSENVVVENSSNSNFTDSDISSNNIIIDDTPNYDFENRETGGLDNSGAGEVLTNQNLGDSEDVSGELGLNDGGFVKSSNLTYYIIGAILIIIIVSSIILIKMNSRNSSSNDAYYKNTKLYVEQYKLSFTKEQIVEELREYKYPEAIIQKVISEEYN